MNKDFKVPSSYLTFDSPGRRHHHLHWMCPISCMILLTGFFNNVLSIGVFKSKTFRFMKLPVYIIITCVLNQLFLIVGTLKVYSCLVDLAKDGSDRPDNSQYPICIYINWVYHVLDYMMDVNLFCALYNRIKAQSCYDVTSTGLNASRIPIIGIMTTAILSIIPSSIYHKQKMKVLKDLPHDRCSHLYIYPYDRKSTLDVIVASIPVVCDALIFLALFRLFSKLFWSSYKKMIRIGRKTRVVSSMAMDGMTNDSGTNNSSLDIEEKTIEVAQKEMEEEAEFNFKKTPFTWLFLSERDLSMTKLTACLASGHILVSTSKHLVRLLNDNSFQDHLESQTKAAIAVETIFMAYLASTFAIFCASSEVFRQLVYKFTFERPVQRHYYTNMALARRMNIIHTYKDELKNTAQDENIDSFVVEDFEVTPAQLRLEHVEPSHGVEAKRHREKTMLRRRVFRSKDNTTWL